MLNPKVALFFLAFLPQFVDASDQYVAFQLAGLGILFDMAGTSVNLLIAAIAGFAGERLKQKMQSTGWLNYISGGVMIALGLRLAIVRDK